MNYNNGLGKLGLVASGLGLIAILTFAWNLFEWYVIWFNR